MNLQSMSVHDLKTLIDRLEIPRAELLELVSKHSNPEDMDTFNFEKSIRRGDVLNSEDISELKDELTIMREYFGADFIEGNDKYLLTTHRLDECISKFPSWMWLYFKPNGNTITLDLPIYYAILKFVGCNKPQKPKIIVPSEL